MLDPVNDVTGLLPRDGLPYNIDQWDGYTDDRREVFAAHPRPRRHATPSSSPATSTPGWACELPYDASTYPASATAPASSSSARSVTSNNLKDITGTPLADRRASRSRRPIKANNRHVKYLNFDDHGFSVLDVTPARVQMDWYVIGDRADRGTGDLLDGVLRHRRPAPRGAPGRASPVGA